MSPNDKITAVIAIIITITVAYSAITMHDIAPALGNAFVLVLGFYFGKQVGVANGQASKPVEPI